MSEPQKSRQELQQELQELPPAERLIRAAIYAEQLETRAVFYHVMPGIPVNFTRFAIFWKQQLMRQEERGKKRRSQSNGIEPYFEAYNFVARAPIADVTVEELEPLMTDIQQIILAQIREQRHILSERLRNDRETLSETARSFSWLGKKLWRRWQMQQINHIYRTLGGILNQADVLWMRLEPEVYQNAAGIGKNITQQDVETAYTQFGGTINPLEAQMIERGWMVGE